MKILIGICDDEAYMIKELRHIIEEYAEEEQQEIEILTYSGGRQLLEEKKMLDILFLDIAMPAMDGIETGRRLREKQRNCRIIMATSMVERFKEAFEIQAFRFTTKPFQKQEIREALEACINLRVGMEEIEFYEARSNYRVMQRDISYLCAYNSSVEAYVDGRMFRKESSLNEMEEMLDHRLFYRVHRQYIINFQHIKMYRDGILYVENLEIPVSRRKRKEFETLYRKFDVMYR